MKKYGICDCNKWGIVPISFKESKHFLKCPSCGKAMYLTIHNPREAGYKESERIEIKEFIEHNG